VTDDGPVPITGSRSVSQEPQLFGDEADGAECHDAADASEEHGHIDDAEGRLGCGTRRLLRNANQSVSTAPQHTLPTGQAMRTASVSLARGLHLCGGGRWHRRVHGGNEVAVAGDTLLLNQLL